MEKGKIDFWDLILLIAALLILFWATLKAFGIINSPAWFDMLPFFSIGIAIIGATYKLGKIKKGIEETKAKVNKILSIAKDAYN